MSKHFHLILDSGAFSAWSKGVHVDLEKYADFILENLHAIDVVVNLDVIPGKPWQKRMTQDEVEASAQKGWDNAQYLLSRGVPVDKLVHVFHQNENFSWLKKMLKVFPYIGLSPANDRTREEKVSWLDDCMPYVLDANGMPRVKFHGFAVTSHKVMKRYPWYSVDSSTWCVVAGRGICYVPQRTRGAWDFLASPHQVSMSMKTTKDSLSLKGACFNRDVRRYFDEVGVCLGESELREVDKDHVLAENEREIKQPKKRGLVKAEGKKWIEVIVKAGVANDYSTRYWLNAEFLVQLQKQLPEWPWAWRPERMVSGRLI